jgi:hypothetical protein
VQLSWTAPTDNGGSAITDYNIYRGTTAGAETLLTHLGAASPTSYADSNVTAKTTYFYYVTAVNAINESAASNEASATPGQTVPDPPVLSGTAGDGVNHLTWTTPDNGGSPIKNYAVIQGTTKIATVDASTNSYDDTQVTNGTTYTYKVRVTTAIGTATSNKVTLTPGTSAAPAQTAPSAPVLTGTSGSAVNHLTWTTPDDGGSPITNYVVVQRTTKIATVDPATHSYDDTQVANGTTYTYKVRAANAIGTATSNKLKLTPTA